MLTDQFLNAWINFRTIGQVGFVVSSKPPQPMPAITDQAVTKPDTISSISVNPALDDLPAINQVHEVQSGETLWRIAKLTTGNATNWRSLAKFNNLNFDVRIRPGQQLKIPANLVTQKQERRLTANNQEVMTKAKSDRAGQKVVIPANTTKDRNSIAETIGVVDTIPNQSTKLHSADGAEPAKSFIAPKTSVNVPQAIDFVQFEQTDTNSPKNMLSPTDLDFMMLL